MLLVESGDDGVVQPGSVLEGVAVRHLDMAALFVLDDVVVDPRSVLNELVHDVEGIVNRSELSRASQAVKFCDDRIDEPEYPSAIHQVLVQFVFVFF